MHRNWKRHPLSEAWGDMPKEEFDALVEDVRANGVHEAIALHPDGRVLDGWNRYQAAIIAGKNPPHITITTDPADYVISKNNHRRHQTAAQRTACILAVREWAPPGRPADDPDVKVHTRAEIADEAGVSVGTVDEVKRGIKDGFEEEIRKGTETPYTLRKRRDEEKPSDPHGVIGMLPDKPVTRMERLIAARNDLQERVDSLQGQLDEVGGKLEDADGEREELEAQLRIAERNAADPDSMAARADGLEVSLRRATEELGRAKASNKYLRLENKELLAAIDELRQKYEPAETCDGEKAPF